MHVKLSFILAAALANLRRKHIFGLYLYRHPGNTLEEKVEVVERHEE